MYLLVLLKNILQLLNVRNMEHIKQFGIILTVRWGVYQEVELKRASVGRTVPQIESRRRYHTLTLVQYRTSAYEISGERSGTGASFLHTLQLFTSSVDHFTHTYLSATLCTVQQLTLSSKRHWNVFGRIKQNSRKIWESNIVRWFFPFHGNLG
jgi:hypothetical protein